MKARDEGLEILRGAALIVKLEVRWGEVCKVKKVEEDIIWRNHPVLLVLSISAAQEHCVSAGRVTLMFSSMDVKCNMNMHFVAYI